ncbi:DUF1345 domain-containing protein [Pedobacter sp.]|jgi:uncharacterized membrane protein|uniref:DUF1345 domain-containing protein n=1 Tax=Pedobacter sp. TaxID=1411316 RepID=UPI002C707EF3|nr:DUF1345 domain-containing protein [Pedobacter sp.]HWW41788.1 DUF1345 domain-containing protein [Pedobacter sp.]
MANFIVFQWINRMDSHYRLYLSLASALATFFLTSEGFAFPIHWMATWLAFTLSNLLLGWITILSSHPIEVRKIAKIQDSSRLLIFIFVILSSIVSLCVVVLLLHSSKGLSGKDLVEHTILSIASVVCAWWLVHTIFTFRYAHLYYGAPTKSNSKAKYIEGLEFPNEKEPDYLDFIYFSFVIGMTFQVSDVQITSKRIRRLAWMHGILSFAFNTVIVALSINVISGLIQQ